MKIEYFVITTFFIFNIGTAWAIDDSTISSFLFASDIECLANFKHKISTKEQAKIRKALISIATIYTKKEDIHRVFIATFPAINLDKAVIENDCLVSRLYSNKDTLSKVFTTSENSIAPASKNLLSENQIRHLSLLFQLRTSFILRYAYFDQKKEIFNGKWRKAIGDIISSVNTDESYTIKSVLNALEDPHVGYFTGGFDSAEKGNHVNVLPFDFRVQDDRIYIKKVIDVNNKLTNNQHLIENDMEISAINGVSASKWIDSIDREIGPFYSDRHALLERCLFYYYFLEGNIAFKVISPKTGRLQEFEVRRIPLDMQDAKEIFGLRPSESDLLKNKRPHFHYVRYDKYDNKLLSELLKSGQPNDTLVIDFRGYPKRDVFAATQLLWGTEERKVAYSLMQNPQTGCFDIREEMTSYNKKQMNERIAIQAKNYVVYGIINRATASYVETSVMTCKAYIANFTLIGEPTAGALGTIDFMSLENKNKISYPYHQFHFYNGGQLNEKSQTVPDINMTREEVKSFILYGN